MFLFKVTVGINLLGFAYKRHSQRREAADLKTVINAASTETEVKSGSMTQTTSPATKSEQNLAQQRSISPFHIPVKSRQSGVPKVDKLDSIDRYTLFRSRIP